jgi:hypothetical protein
VGRHAYITLLPEFTGKRALGSPWRYEDKINMDLMDIGCEVGVGGLCSVMGFGIIGTEPGNINYNITNINNNNNYNNITVPSMSHYQNRFSRISL